MADLSGSNLEQNQLVIRSELDQEKREAWEMLFEADETFTDRFIEFITGLWDTDEQPERAIVLLAHIGWLHMLESHVPGN